MSLSCSSVTQQQLRPLSLTSSVTQTTPSLWWPLLENTGGSVARTVLLRDGILFLPLQYIIWPHTWKSACFYTGTPSMCQEVFGIVIVLELGTTVCTVIFKNLVQIILEHPVSLVLNHPVSLILNHPVSLILNHPVILAWQVSGWSDECFTGTYLVHNR